jgi:hypothetical protein
MSIWRAFYRKLHGAPEPKPSLLSEQQARDVAETAVLGTHHAGNMWMAELGHLDGRLIWIVGSASVGSGITVTIDDATGDVISCKPWGIR